MNHKLRKKNRWVPILLCCAILLTLTAPFVSNVFGREDKVEITLAGEDIDRFSIQEDEKVTLTADPSGFDPVRYQWQILLDSQAAIWVNIADKTAPDCEVSVALLNAMLDEHNCAYLRCAVTGEENQVYSEPVCALVVPAPEPEQENTAEEQLRAIVEDPLQMRSIENAYNAANAVVLNSGSGGGEDEDEDNYLTITIQYLSGGMESQFTPYVATIKEGLEFHQSVVSPTIMGFAPFLDVNKNGTRDAGESDATSVPLDYDAVTESLVFHVVYEPIKVSYGVRHFFQNVADDLYTERADLYQTGSEYTGTTITDDMIKAPATDTVGFTSLYHVPESVAADGSTVFECYYDRNYYLIQFDLGGGYGVDPIYARYESTFVIPDPIQAGYTFSGWELVSIDKTPVESWVGDLPVGVFAGQVPSSVPAHNLLYRAKWTAGDASYTVAYWVKRKDGSVEFIESKDVDSGVHSGDPVAFSDDLTDRPFCGLDVHSHNSDCYECWYCYSIFSPKYIADQADNVKATFAKLQTRMAEHNAKPENRTHYRYRNPDYSMCFNYLYLNGTWYFVGTMIDYRGLSISPTPHTITGVPYDDYETGTVNRRSSPGHTHTDDCLICKKPVHTHENHCWFRRHYEYDSASTIAANTIETDAGDGSTTVSNKPVAGDGSTVVNVYYKPKEYTLQFYYAAERVDGSGETIYEILGGSTYPFGASTGVSQANQTNTIALLDYAFDADYGNNVGVVTALPTFNTEGVNRGYQDKQTTASPDGRIYHYFEVKAEYGQNIYNLWPCSVLDPAFRRDDEAYPFSNINKWGEKVAFFSAWNGEHHVWYSQHNANQTIKGKYAELDYQLLYDIDSPNNYSDSLTVAYLCFWENGSGRVRWNRPNLFLYNIWVPVQDSDVLTGPNAPITEVYNGVRYKRIDCYPTCDNSSYWDTPVGVQYIQNQTHPGLPGYRAVAKEGGTEFTEEELTHCTDYDSYDEHYVIDFYYEPLTYAFAAQNYENLVASYDAVAVGSPLAPLVEGSMYIDPYAANPCTPTYPSTLEPNAYEFKGWYPTEDFIPGTEVDLAHATMPTKGLMVYADWELVKHTVNFFASYDSMLEYEGGTVTGWSDTATDPAHWKKTVSVSHGKDITTAVSDPDPDNSDPFKGWFYLDENGEKKLLESQNMPIHQDLNVFAERHTSSTVPYIIHYTYEDPETHVVTKIADDTTGEAFLNSTCTFTAKAGDQLYSGYQTNYFPKARSHSINMRTGENEYTFEYVTVTGTPQYTVRYLDKLNRPIPISGSSPVAYYGDAVKNATAAVAKERFMAIANMVPDAFFKKLVLQAEYNGTNWVVNPENNVITFYYIENSGVAMYGVHYMLEKVGATDAQRTDYAIDGSGGYEQTGTMIEGIGNISDGYAPVPPQEFPGFELVASPAPKVVHANGSVTNAAYSDGAYKVPIEAEGTEMYVFYRRKSYPYHIRYYLYNTDAPVPDSTAFDSGADIRRLGSTVTATAPPFTGYTVVKKNTDPLPYEKSITINVEDPSSDPVNVITFYYTPNQYIAEFIAVPEAGGTLSSTIEVRNGSETFAGSTPTAKTNYDFEGWYLDEDCTVPVTSEEGTVDSTTKTLVPNRTNMTPGERHLFYAKFVKRAGNLTITRSGAETDQVFVYKVQNTTTEAVYYVTVTGNGSVTIHDLPMGTYTVTQQKDWSWRYDEHDADVPYKTVVHDDTVTTVTFSAAAQTDQWVNGNTAPVPNQRGS